MKKINPSIDDLQIICMNPSLNLNDLAKARRNLFQAIREALIEAGASKDYILKYDQKTQ